MNIYKEKEMLFFAASNSKDGFVSYFDEIFGENECDRVYILKGGPGCGKSTFIKRLGKAAEEKGLSCDYFLCSSDPGSFDGIIIRKKKIAVIDGTNPHAAEPSLSGAREIIIDLGRSWDTEKLFECRDDIQKLSAQKQKSYKAAYGFLYSKNVMDCLVFNLVCPCIDFDKMEKSAKRLSKSILCNAAQDGEKEKIRLTEALSANGRIRLFTFENTADFCVFLKEPFKNSRLPHLFMKKIHDRARDMETEMYVSFSPDKKGEINALYFPDCKTSVSVYDENAVLECDRSFKKCKIINCARFVDLKSLSHTKPLRRFYSKLSDSMEKQALEALSSAGIIHADTEKIYRQCTDYTTVENVTNEYINKILNSQSLLG